MSKTYSKPYAGDTEAVIEARKYTQANGLPDPYRAYALQRKTAQIREIGWEFTFAQWWAIWQPYFHMRGRGTNGLCMARERDVGPYSPSNAYLTTNLGNLQDYHRKSPQAIDARRIAKEKKEMAFARAGTTSGADRSDLRSHLAYKSNNTSKSTCNYRDELAQWELSLG